MLAGSFTPCLQPAWSRCEHRVVSGLITALYIVHAQSIFISV